MAAQDVLGAEAVAAGVSTAGLTAIASATDTVTVFTNAEQVVSA